MHLCVHVCMFGCGDGLCYAICSGFPGPCSGVFVCLQAAVVIMCCFVLKKPWRSLREFCPGPGGYQFVFLFPRRHGGFARVLFKRDDVGIQCIVLFMKPRRVLVICLRRRGHSVVVVLVVLANRNAKMSLQTNTQTRHGKPNHEHIIANQSMNMSPQTKT